LKGLVQELPNTFIIIMTVGYRTDVIALDALIEKKVEYLKILGSKAKLQALYKEYKKKGIAEHKITCLLQPAGLYINSQSPQEIAISIAAEIIGVKNKVNS
jgi:xanthine dehydrogenase accessory factor